MLHRWQFCPGEKRGDKVSKTKRGKGTKWMVVVDGTGVPLGNHMDSASPAEVKLAENTLATILVPEVVSNLNWGGSESRTLYITASSSVYRIELKVPGVRP